MLTISDQATQISPGFAKWLNDQRQARGMSQAELSRKSQLPVKFVRDLGNDRRGFARYFQLRAIARALDIPYEEIYKAAGCEPPDNSEVQEQLRETVQIYRTLLDLVGGDESVQTNTEQ